MAAEGAVDEVVQPGDPLVARRRQVEAAVVALRAALGEDAARPGAKGPAAALRRNVDKWERALRPDAKSLTALPSSVVKARNRLADAHKPAYETFVRATEVIRKSFRGEARAPQARSRNPPTRGATLSDEVRAVRRPPRSCVRLPPSFASQLLLRCMLLRGCWCALARAMRA